MSRAAMMQFRTASSTAWIGLALRAFRPMAKVSTIARNPVALEDADDGEPAEV